MAGQRCGCRAADVVTTRQAIEIVQGLAAVHRHSGRYDQAEVLDGAARVLAATAANETTAKITTSICPECGSVRAARGG